MYLNTTTKEQVTEQQIRSLFPNTSFATPFKAPSGYAVVFPFPKPVYNPISQFVREIAPVLTPVGYEQRWEVIDLEPEQVAANQAAAYSASIPKVVSRAQFILALLQIGLLDEVEAAIAAADRATQINYKERLEFDRSYPLIATMAQVMGKTDAEIDALFVLAATL